MAEAVRAQLPAVGQAAGWEAADAARLETHEAEAPWAPWGVRAAVRTADPAGPLAEHYDLVVCTDPTQLPGYSPPPPGTSPPDEPQPAALRASLEQLAASLRPHGLLVLAQPPHHVGAPEDVALHAALRAAPRLRAVALPSPDGDGGLVTLVHAVDDAELN